MIWFVVGAGLGVLHMVLSLVWRPITINHPVRGFSVSAGLGAATYGTILWLLANYVFI
jgi:hypothetical protein